MQTQSNPPGSWVGRFSAMVGIALLAGLVIHWFGSSFITFAQRHAGDNKRPSVLDQMPVNSGGKWFGISVVVASLLEGERSDSIEAQTAEQVASAMFTNILLDDRLVLPTHVSEKGELFSIKNLSENPPRNSVSR